MKKVFILIFLSIFFISCSKDKKDELKIVTSNWIGYTPLFYAKELGYLDALNIKLLSVVSLSESLYTYKSTHADVFLGTQYEYKESLKTNNKVIPIMLLNKSDGGDVVMSNKSIDELKTEEGIIDVFLEVNSINYMIFEDFIAKYKLNDKKFNYINKDQSFIAEQKVFKNSAIVITYNPYNIVLEKNGLKTLLSTKDSDDLLVIDAMFTSKDTLIKYYSELKELKNIIDIAVEELHKNPKEYYELIKDYLYDTKYEDFIESTQKIKWINKNPSEAIIDNLKAHNIPIKDIL
jgi:NitT/TauT family transport system substrate-binding protein